AVGVVVAGLVVVRSTVDEHRYREVAVGVRVRGGGPRARLERELVLRQLFHLVLLAHPVRRLALRDALRRVAAMVVAAARTTQLLHAGDDRGDRGDQTTNGHKHFGGGVEKRQYLAHAPRLVGLGA